MLDIRNSFVMSIQIMEAITLIQPWASLVEFDEKLIDIRRRGTSYRGPLLIHAGKKIDKDVMKINPYKAALLKHGLASKEGGILFKNIPLGVIIARCMLSDCLKIIKEVPGKYAILEDGRKVEGREYFFGFYGEGRYAWILKDIKALKKPVSAKGQLSL